MPIHTLKLIKQYPIANNTRVFEFEKPTGFNFKPGQYGGFTLINPAYSDSKGATRRFSLLNAPHDNHLAFATRMQTSAYKQSLAEMTPDQLIKFAGPTGIFTLHEEIEIPTVMIAGGIGISPFYSMLRDTWHNQSPRSMTLLYGNRSLEDTAFFKEFREAADKEKTFRFTPIFELADAKWQGKRGLITEEIIRSSVDDIMAPFYYVCGSPTMVTNLQETLLEMNIPPERIKVEDFPGY